MNHSEKIGQGNNKYNLDLHIVGSISKEKTFPPAVLKSLRVVRCCKSFITTGTNTP